MSAAVALTPRVRIMVICDAVKQSKTEAGVFNLKGVRQAMTARAFPFAPSLWLFLLLSSARAGVFPAYVRVINDRTNRVVYQANLKPRPEFDFDGEALALGTPMHCNFLEEGVYTVQFWFFQVHGHDVLKAEMPFTIKTEGGIP
jgi:hypothetical protein